MAENPPTDLKRIDLRNLQPGPIRHPSLTSDQLERIKRIHAALHEVDEMPFEQMVENFQRDRDLDPEIRVHETMVEAYETYCRGRNLSLPARREAFSLILLRSLEPDEKVLQDAKLTLLSEADAREVLRCYKAPFAPVQVTRQRP